MVGPPRIIFGTDGALEALLDGLSKEGPEPQRTMFQALGTTEKPLPTSQNGYPPPQW